MTNKIDIPTNLKDDQIVEIARKVDTLIAEVGDEYSPTALEFVSIALGRLMVFSKAVGVYPQFHELMDTVIKMGSADIRPTESLNKTEGVSDGQTIN